MDFLDPKKQQRHRIILLVGYLLIAIAIGIGSIILLYLASGWRLNKNGEVIQNGLVFVSSRPSSAHIYLDGKIRSSTTNARLVIPAGAYKMMLQRDGYRTWGRVISVNGGDVEHFDYPFLLPQTLTSTDKKTYSSSPGLSTQSPDRRWLLVAKAGSINSFDEFNLKNSKASVIQDPVSLTFPANLFAKAKAKKKSAIEIVEWSSDNRHVLVKHVYDNKYEFLVLDRQNPGQSVNLNKTLNTSPTEITLQDKKYDKYYVYFAKGGLLKTTSLADPVLVNVLSGVIGYKTHGRNDILYVVKSQTSPKEVDVKLKMGDKTYQLRRLAAGSKYLLDFAQYSGSWYVAAGATSQNRVYVYKDPEAQLRSTTNVTIPISVLKVKAPNYLSFSDNARFIMTENQGRFSLYDAENDKTYSYNLTSPVDKPQPHAKWMDGNHLDYVSNGSLVMFDFDKANPQTLVRADPRYEAFFTPDYKYMYSMLSAKTKAGITTTLSVTPLLTQADL